MSKCALCQEDRELKESHIIPKFVFRRIKANSPTGGLRNREEPNIRLQDGSKEPMLCCECEQRFSKVETLFAESIFSPFQDGKFCEFKYGPWLHYFVTSVNWRSLYLDCAKFRSNKALDQSKLAPFYDAEKNMRTYLCKDASLWNSIDNHIFFWTSAESVPENSVGKNPNVLIRASAFGYSFADGDGYYVWSNLAGIIITTIISPCLGEIWEGTKISDNGLFVMGSAQKMSSPVGGEIQHQIEKTVPQMSDRQRQKLKEFVEKYPDKILDSKLYDYIKMDKKLSEE